MYNHQGTPGKNRGIQQHQNKHTFFQNTPQLFSCHYAIVLLDIYSHFLMARQDVLYCTAQTTGCRPNSLLEMEFVPSLSHFLICTYSTVMFTHIANYICENYLNTVGYSQIVMLFLAQSKLWNCFSKLVNHTAVKSHCQIQLCYINSSEDLQLDLSNLGISSMGSFNVTAYTVKFQRNLKVHF